MRGGLKRFSRIYRSVARASTWSGFRCWIVPFRCLRGDGVVARLSSSVSLLGLKTSGYEGSSAVLYIASSHEHLGEHRLTRRRRGCSTCRQMYLVLSKALMSMPTYVFRFLPTSFRPRLVRTESEMRIWSPCWLVGIECVAVLVFQQKLMSISW